MLNKYYLHKYIYIYIYKYLDIHRLSHLKLKESKKNRFCYKQVFQVKLQIRNWCNEVKVKVSNWMIVMFLGGKMNELKYEMSIQPNNQFPLCGFVCVCVCVWLLVCDWWLRCGHLLNAFRCWIIKQVQYIYTIYI